MAKKTITTTEYIDDLDGSIAERSIEFSYDGVSYEIDLNKKNAAALDKLMKPYLSAARTTKTARTRSSTGSRAKSKSGRRTDLATIRDWANNNGHTLSNRGRIPAHIIEAYDTAR